MSLKNFLCNTLFFLLSTPAFAANYMSFMGGGGEPVGATTIFDAQVTRMGNFDRDNTWNKEVSFNGGHSTTETLLQNSFGRRGVANRPFTEDSYEKTIKDYEDKINNGTIKSGDQLMLIISTHGAEKQSTERTHQISVSGGTIANFDTGEGSKLVPLDRLQNLTSLAQAKGIKLAILDLSCHSGNALALKNANTCVISASGPNHYGYGGNGNTFMNLMVSNLVKGRTLESAFLNARKNFSDTSFPMISSPVGLEINEELYTPITPFLYNYDDKHDKFSPYVKREAAKGEACQAPIEIESLMNLIREVESMRNIPSALRYSSGKARKFRDSLQRYYALLTRLRTEVSQFNLPDLKIKENICSEYDNPAPHKSSTCFNYSRDQILTADLAWLRNFYNNYLTDPAKTQVEKDFARASLENVTKIATRRAELLAANPDLVRLQNYFKLLPNLEEQTRRMASDVSNASQDFYHSLYQQKALSDTRPNPCRDFVL